MNNLTWTENNTPKSKIFEDIYYNAKSGLEEKKYVFVDGNNLDDKFLTLISDFNILELGFGTGLSFLVTAIEFAKSGSEYNLNFTSTELYPLEHDSIQKALKAWPEFYNTEIVQDFLNQYKKADLTKDINIKLGNINLCVLVGDANIKLKEVNQKQDCLYLDGFAPGKNESMWCEGLFKLIKPLCKVETTAATYSASRVVKDRIEQLGLSYKKRKGFGAKRDMLITERE
ncbi:MAG: tRNA (5-methylaminomethyl-2-thiouridine)(34)-methyltransferase MnmD [Proteobacteria bacterium]|nr:tRNA (5-methylaminomethyl-2-thiouridine)(34)-methyltransferase MnmD [Pseudomonadota bacterium]